ncbi:hypothetical protein [Streptomyces johnsoniae]|uniref:XRE family transcriptional regulator n=1 Tax=Streptomyces johnsoniae TaxID=3075532 RepID=A0ABU2S9P6_9ACTN|nr:hypothetical protein [Streptomyces sp. DSM 41886]MDT0445707.1 hypothetical protein [Streptomyces sp. DSM 41886]
MSTLLRVLLRQRNWSYSTFRSHLEKAARELAETDGTPGLGALSVSESSYERWCAGTVTPQPDARRVLERLFGFSADELLAPVATPAAPARGDLGSAAEDDDSDQHDLKRSAAMAAQRAMKWAMTAESQQVGPETMAHMREEVHRLAVAYPRVALGTILDDLVDVQDTIFRILESGWTKPGQARDLHLLAALASGILAKASHDLGDPVSAMRQARAAYICADQADHAAARGWIRGLQSLVAYWAGRPEDAAHYARSGEAATPQDTGTVRVWLAGLQARAAAVLGDADGMSAAIRKGEDARDRVQLDDLDAIGGLVTFPYVRELYYTAEAEVLLPGATPTAEQRAVAAVAAYESADRADWAYGDEAGARTNLALARISGDQLDGAAEAIRPVLDLPTGQRTAGIVISAQRVHRALAETPSRNALPARELRVEIEAFAAAPARTLSR